MNSKEWSIKYNEQDDDGLSPMEIGGGSGDIEPSWIRPNNDGITNDF